MTLPPAHLPPGPLGPVGQPRTPALPPPEGLDSTLDHWVHAPTLPRTQTAPQKDEKKA